MKRKIIAILMGLLALCLTVGAFTACNNDNSSTSTKVNKIDSSLLDGKLANFMGAEAFGIMDKSTQAVPYSDVKSSDYPIRVYADDNSQTQKEAEFIKETADGYVEVHFHEKGNAETYKELNNKYEKHHHDGKECFINTCDMISDEITAEETAGEYDTIMSLDARINKLYNYKNFTFMSVSSAIEGKIEVISNTYMPSINKTTLISLKNSYPALVNIENHFSVNGSGWGFGYINILESEENPAGIIPMKISENETAYHTSNYWSDYYNQSYIIDNNTGITYSLAQFPHIYSVDNGVIKVHDESVPGWFRYYNPVVSESGMTFEEIKLPTEQEFVANLPPCATSSSVIIDVYGNMLFNSVGQLSQNFQVDEYGEKKFGKNVILAMSNYEHYTNLKKSQEYGQYGGLFAERYQKANRYHRGSDGRIYRVDFRGLLGDVKVHVLDSNCTWQQVDDSVSVTFDRFFNTICWWAGLDRVKFDSFKITKIEGGYAYYSTACASDGVNIWASVALNNELKTFGDYAGVVKISVNGPDSEKSYMSVYDEFFNNNVNPFARNIVFLIGETQMLYHANNKLFILDVESGKKSFVTTTSEMILIGIERNNLIFSIDGQTKYLNVLLQCNAEDLASSLSSTKVEIGGELDAYFKFIINQ